MAPLHLPVIEVNIDSQDDRLRCLTLSPCVWSCFLKLRLRWPRSRPRTIEQLLMARSSRPASDHCVILLTNCSLHNTISLASGARSRPGYSRGRSSNVGNSLLHQASFEFKLELLSIARPAFIAEPANRIHGVVAFLQFPPSHARDWSDMHAFVKNCSPAAHFTSRRTQSVRYGPSNHAQTQQQLNDTSLGHQVDLESRNLRFSSIYPQLQRAVARTFAWKWMNLQDL